MVGVRDTERENTKPTAAVGGGLEKGSDIYVYGVG